MRLGIFCLSLCLLAPMAQAQGTALVVAASEEATLRQAILAVATAQMGVPYVYGGQSPRGFDCTGLVFYAYQSAAKFTLPRSTRHLATFGAQISLAEALPGDILIFDTTGGPSHAGLYLGNNKVLHSASAGPRTGVIISDMSERYYQTRFLYGRRAITPQGTAPSVATVAPGLTMTENGLKLISQQPSLSAWPDKPLTTFSVDLQGASGPSSLMEALPLAQGTLVEYQVRGPSRESGWYDVIYGSGSYGGLGFTPTQTIRIPLEAGTTWLSPQWENPREGTWTLVVLDMEGRVVVRHQFTVVAY